MTKINVEGLAEARSDLRAVDSQLGREVGQALKKAASVVGAEARVRAPKRTGRLAASIKPSARGARAFVRSPLVYAPVIHYGSPKRGIRARPFIAEAAESKAGEALRVLADELDQLLKRKGF